MRYFSIKFFKNALSHVPMWLKYKNHYVQERHKTQKSINSMILFVRFFVVVVVGTRNNDFIQEASRQRRTILPELEFRLFCTKRRGGVTGC